MGEIITDRLEGGGVMVTVADTLVTYDLQGDITALSDTAVKLKLIFLFDLADRQ